MGNSYIKNYSNQFRNKALNQNCDKIINDIAYVIKKHY